MEHRGSLALFSVIFLASLSLALLHAQAPAKPDSSAVVLHLEKARLLARTQWTSAYQFFCVNPHANSNDDPAIEPSKIFDNVYVIGNTGTVAYAITTPEGIILLDSLAANQVDTVLLPGMRKLGLDPDQVKLIVVAHGHADHFGGSVYFQKHGAHVAMSAADWDFIAPKPGAPARGPAPPSRDLVLVEGQSVGLGDVRILPVLTPGHTPGSMAFIFPVKDNGKTYTAGMFGGTMLTATRPTPEEINQYLTSVKHFRDEALKAGVEVELQNHPLMDDLTGRLAQLRERGANGTNPFIVGRENYPLFLDILSECMLAQVGRRAQ